MDTVQLAEEMLAEEEGRYPAAADSPAATASLPQSTPSPHKRYNAVVPVEEDAKEGSDGGDGGGGSHLGSDGRDGGDCGGGGEEDPDPPFSTAQLLYYRFDSWIARRVNQMKALALAVFVEVAVGGVLLAAGPLFSGNASAAFKRLRGDVEGPSAYWMAWSFLVSAPA